MLLMLFPLWALVPVPLGQMPLSPPPSTARLPWAGDVAYLQADWGPAAPTCRQGLCSRLGLEHHPTPGPIFAAQAAKAKHTPRARTHGRSLSPRLGGWKAEAKLWAG